MKTKNYLTEVLILSIVFNLAIFYSEKSWSQTVTGPYLPHGFYGEFEPAANNIRFMPSNSTFLPSWTISYFHSETQNRAPISGSGDGFYIGIPLFFGFATTVGGEYLRENEEFKLQDMVNITWNLSWGYKKIISLGFNFNWLGVDDNSFFSFDAGVTLRPFWWLSFGLGAFQLNNPIFSEQAENGYNRWDIQRKWLITLGIRPNRFSEFTISTGLLYGEEDGTIQNWLSISAPIKSNFILAKGFVGLQWQEDQEINWYSGVGLQFNFPYVSISGDIFSSHWGLNDSSWQGGSVGLTINNITRSLRSSPYYIVKVGLNSDMSSEDIFAIANYLEELRLQPDVRGILLNIGNSFSASLSEVEELRESIYSLKDSEKKIYCYSSNYTQNTFYLCAGSDKIWLDPEGTVDITGVNIDSIYLASFINKLGIKAEIIRFKEYKSTPEMFTKNAPSPQSEENFERFLSDYNYNWLRVISNTKHSLKRINNIVNNEGLILADRAKELNLVDKLIFDTQIESEISSELGNNVSIDSNYQIPEPDRWNNIPGIALIIVDGTIISGRSLHIPEFGINLSGSETIKQQLEKVRNNPLIKGVVIRIDSSGGEAYASEMIWREVFKTRDVKPVIVSMGPISASGGYYIACAANEIFALPTTLTGSIGIFSGKVDISGLTEKLGISIHASKRGELSGYNSIFRPWTDQQLKILTKSLEHDYNLFLERIKIGRKNFKNIKQIDDIAGGRIWSGQRAKELGLVDRIGGMQKAIYRLYTLTKLSPQSPVYLIDSGPEGIIPLLFNTGTVSNSNSSEFVNEHIKQIGSWLYPMMKNSPDSLALLPFIITIP